MKKSLLPLLAIALAAVGCQNYDDQFDDLNGQLAALSSQVAGLAQVQNDLSSLSSTVASLQGSIKSTVDAALGESLTEIQAAIDSLTEASDNIATGDDVDNITDSLEGVEQD
ncbi:MAG: hypothetical protein ISP72_07005, partial [Flavobacteriaceae bacterium]|nr:hypothetical protein [Flavobacteriaceae bacterium]